MKTLITTLTILLFTNVFVFAQNENTNFELPRFSPLVENERKEVRSSTQHWWEPEIVLLHKLSGELSREVRSYNEQGLILSRSIENLESNIWMKSRQYAYTYDEQGNTLTDIHETWENEAWLINERRTYTYDEQGNMLSHLYESLQEDILTNWEQNIYSFDSNGNLLYSLYQQWKSGEWVNSWKQSYEYDNRNNILLDLYEYWFLDNLNSSRKRYTYDERDNMLTMVSENLNAGSWVETNSETYTYDEKNNVLSRITDFFGMRSRIDFSYDEWNNILIETSLNPFFDNGLEDWKAQRRMVMTYNTPTHQMTSQTIELIEEDNSWRESERQIMSYDENENRIDLVFQIKDGSEWKNSWGNFYSYDTNNNLISNIYRMWREEAWLNNERLLYEYNAQNKMLLNMKQSWNAEEWINVQANKYVYDDHNNLLTMSYEFWRDGEVTFGSKTDYTYDENNNGILGEYFDWINGNWIATDGSSRQIIYNNGESSYTSPLGQWSKVETSYEIFASCLAPINLTVDFIESNAAKLQWNAQEENTESTYSVYRDGELIESGIETTTYLDNTELTVGIEYTWCVVANAIYFPLTSEETCISKEFGNSINEVFNDSKTMIYPNPTDGELNIKSESNIGLVKVFDASGKLLKEINNINNTKTSIDLGGLVNGIYLLNIDGTTMKVLKQ